MNKKATDIVAYATLVGFIVAMVAGDRENSKFHLNQALVILIAEVIASAIASLSLIKYIGWIFGLVGGAAGVFCTVCWVIGFVRAIVGDETPVPVLGQYKILK